jgi:hypothetical protein
MPTGIKDFDWYVTTGNRDFDWYVATAICLLIGMLLLQSVPLIFELAEMGEFLTSRDSFL